MPLKKDIKMSRIKFQTHLSLKSAEHITDKEMYGAVGGLMGTILLDRYDGAGR